MRNNRKKTSRSVLCLRRFAPTALSPPRRDCHLRCGIEKPTPFLTVYNRLSPHQGAGPKKNSVCCSNTGILPGFVAPLRLMASTSYIRISLTRRRRFEKATGGWSASKCSGARLLFGLVFRQISNLQRQNVPFVYSARMHSSRLPNKGRHGLVEVRQNFRSPRLGKGRSTCEWRESEFINAETRSLTNCCTGRR